MMNQETYVETKGLHAQGWTMNEIAEATGWHRSTVSDQLKNGPPPERRATAQLMMTDVWRESQALAAFLHTYMKNRYADSFGESSGASARILPTRRANSSVIGMWHANCDVFQLSFDSPRISERSSSDGVSDAATRTSSGFGTPEPG